MQEFYTALTNTVIFLIHVVGASLLIYGLVKVFIWIWLKVLESLVTWKDAKYVFWEWVKENPHVLKRKK